MFVYYITLTFLSILFIVIVYFQKKINSLQKEILKLRMCESKYQMKYKDELFYLKKQIAADLHDEIGSNLLNIGTISTVLLKSGTLCSNQITNVNTIKIIVDESTQSLKNMVWFLNPENTSLDCLASKMNKELHERCGNLQIDFSYEQPKSSITTSRELRKQLYLIFREAVQNILKHSQATEIRLKLYLHNLKLNFLISDNGIGFRKEHIIEGNGLKNLTYRAKLIDGNISINSSELKGTEILLQVGVGFSF